MNMSLRILALNAGSRSHIARLYAVEDPMPFEPPEPVWHAEIESSSATFDDLLEQLQGEIPDAVGHRVVHPGVRYAMKRSARIDAGVREAIEAAVPLAPGHNPLALEGIAAATRRFARLPQVAVFDTVIDERAPHTATTYALPADWTETFGLRRLGFHGISHRDATMRVAALAATAGRSSAKIVSVHMGNGCSVAGFVNGRCVTSTMGFTPMEGTMMGTRSGSIDPGIIFHLVRDRGLSLDVVERRLNKESGLAGVSGISADTRDLLARIERGDERARFALDLYVDRLRFHVGAIAATIGGVDALSFTGPVGEHMSGLRSEVCAHLAFAGVALDAERNRTARPDCAVHRDDSRAGVYVIRTLEEWAVAYETAAVLNR